MGGMVLETNMNEILSRYQEQDKLEKQEVSGVGRGGGGQCTRCLQAGLSAAPGRAVSAVKNMNIPQQIKDIKLPDMPSLSNFKFSSS